MTTITSIQKSSRPTCRLTGKAFWPLFGREVSVAAFWECAWEPELGMEWMVRDDRLCGVLRWAGLPLPGGDVYLRLAGAKLPVLGGMTGP